MARSPVTDVTEALDEADQALLRQVGFISLVPDELRHLVCRMFRKEHFEFGEEVCHEGEVPHSLFLLAAGTLRAISMRDGAEVMLARIEPGEVFGEDALLEGTARTETIRASEDSVVFRLPREAFDAIVLEYPDVRRALDAHVALEEIRRTLRLHPAFSVIPLSVLTSHLSAFQRVDVPAGEHLLVEGDVATSIWLVERGSLSVRSTDAGDDSLATLRAGDFFGELGLLHATPAGATVTAQSDTRLIRVDDADVRALMQASARFEERLREMAQRQLRHAEVPRVSSSPTPMPETGAETPQGHHIASDMPDATPTVDSRRPRRRGRFPFVRQFDEADCAVACLAMVARHFGRRVSLSFIRDAAGTSTQGTTLTGIVDAGRAMGIDVSAIHASKDRVDEMALPAIVHYRGNHWIVLHAMTAKDALVADPSIGVIKIPREEFLTKWTGYAALCRRTDRLDEAPIDHLSIKWMVPFLLQQRAALSFALLLALALGACEVAVPVTIDNLINLITAGKSFAQINATGFVLLGLVVLTGVLSAIRNRVVVRVSVGFDTDSLDFLTGRLLHLPMSYFSRRKTGDIERRISGMVGVRTLVIQGGINAGTDSMLLIVAIALMAYYSTQLTVVFCCLLPIYGLLMWYSQRRLRPIFAAAEEAHGLYQAHQVDLLKGVETVKTLGAEPGLQVQMRGSLGNLNQQLAPSYMALGRYRAIVSVLTLSTYTLFVYLGALEVHAKNLNLSGYVAFMTLVLIATSPIIGLLIFWDEVQNSTVLLARIHDVLSQPPEQSAIDKDLIDVENVTGHVAVHDVEFRFREGERAILSGINLEIPPGTKVALVGRSGCGKSTLLRLLAGLIVPTKGSITYDGVDLSDVRLQSLRTSIGYVLQSPYTFDATLAENIGFGDENINREAVERAAAIADVDSFVASLPLGYETRIGDGGLTLSGGQAQRISIARALYRDPPIIFFDEATSALDAESEQTIKRNLDLLAKGRTTFIVTHRLASIRDCDLIVVLDGGTLIEQGTHQQLMDNGGLYAHLYHQQYVDVPSV